MIVLDWHHDAAGKTARRLADRLRRVFAKRSGQEAAFAARLAEHGPRLLAGMHALYGWSYDFHWHLEELILTAARAAATRPADLLALDRARTARPDWFVDHKALGAIAYVDLYAGSLAGVRARIPQLKAFGITYLHLMPLFAVPDGENDGGYAVSSYRAVRADLGTMAELAALARDLRGAGISLCVDFILNHTADDHPWAEAARRGDAEFQAFYWMFDDRRLPDRYQPHLRAIFPDRGGDSFTWRPDVPGPHGGKWVWTTFYTFQWDLNYRNPAVMTAMAGEMLFLANQGVEVLRMDAVPFLWKEPGTSCENRPEGHVVMAVLNAVAALAAPALVFKSEAIVHPDDVARWVTPEECRISYNPLVMASLWEAAAASDARLLNHALANRLRLPAGTTWVNYLRCHDDIGWAFANEDAVSLKIDPARHRQYLNAFYTNRFAGGSFARGLPFQDNPETGDCRICGTLASLAGLEAAMESGKPGDITLAIDRILMLNALMLTLPGLPLIYLGDEVAMLNDLSYRDDPAKAADARWVHRPPYPQARLANAGRDPSSPEGRVLAGMKALIAFRKATPALASDRFTPLDLGDRALVAFRRGEGRGAVTVVANMASETRQCILPAPGATMRLGTAVAGPKQALSLPACGWAVLTA